MSEIEDVLESARNRRNFVRNMGLAGAAAGIVASGAGNLEAQSSAPTDFDILNFALNLEYLEAEFYTMATSGLYINSFEVGTSGSGTAGATTGGQAVPFSGPDSKIRLMALELANDERLHVALLRNSITALGGTPIAKPAINIAALGAQFFTSETGFLTLARIFEEIGVTAYAGAANLLSNKTAVAYAARILAAEAEHVGFIRALIGANSIATAALDTVDILPPPTGSQYFSLNSAALAGIRTPGQVLYIAYGAANATSGSHFPNGVNGNLNTSSAAAATSDMNGFTLIPNPITGVNGFGSTTIYWDAPGVSTVSIRLGSPAGPYFIYGGTTGSMTTPNWVQDGMVFYLQNATNSATEQTYAQTLATAIAHVGSNT